MAIKPVPLRMLNRLAAISTNQPMAKSRAARRPARQRSRVNRLASTAPTMTRAKLPISATR
ncbi:hypothetical protein D3C71_1631060 [compost metagenome]